MEVYTFTGRVAERWSGKQPQIQIVPDDPQALLAYIERAGLNVRADWHGDEIHVTVGSRRLVEQSVRADRVRYSVTRRGTRMFGVALQPL